MNKCNHIKRGILLIFLGILLVSLVQAQESKSPIFSFSKSYPDYVVFLPEGKIDSVFYHAHSSIIPVIFKVNKYDLFPNKQLDSIVEVLSRVQKDASVRIAYLWIGGGVSVASVGEIFIERNRISEGFDEGGKSVGRLVLF